MSNAPNAKTNTQSSFNFLSRNCQNFFILKFYLGFIRSTTTICHWTSAMCSTISYVSI